MQDEIKILQFLSDQNGRCTHGEFDNFDDTPLGQLTICLKDLCRAQYVQDYKSEYILTEKGRTRLAELKSAA